MLGKDADKHTTKTAEAEKKQSADKHAAKGEKKRGNDGRVTKKANGGDEHTAKAEKKRKHHAGDDKQTAQHHDKHRKVELTER